MAIESINTGNSSYERIRNKGSHQQNNQKSSTASEDFEKPDALENDDLDQISSTSKQKKDTSGQVASSGTHPGMVETDLGYIKDPATIDPEYYAQDRNKVYSSTTGTLRNGEAPLYSDPIAAREALREQYNKAKGITGEKMAETPEAAAEAEIQQQQFMKASQTVDGEGKVATDPRVAAMLENGMFSDNDSQGKSLVENLNALKNQKFHPGIDGEKVYQEVLETLSNPESLHQGNKATCGATVAQYKLIKENPAEYVRLLSGITEKNGMAQMRNGDSLTLNQSALSEDGSGRRMTDKLFQASLMEYGKDDLRYNNITDRHYQADKIDNSGILYTNDIFGARAPKSLDVGNITNVLNGLLPYQSEYKVMPDDTTKMGSFRTTAKQDIESSLQKGHSVPVALLWSENGGNHAAHALTVEGIQGDKVILRNPWGQGDNGSPGNGLQRDLLTNGNGQHGGMIAIDRELFFKSLHSYEMRVDNKNNEENRN